MHVEIEALRFTRDQRVVLDIPSLVLRDGRVTAVLGPNGAGKTTLLRLIAALERPDGGSIRAGGTAISTSTAMRRKIALVFQENVFLRQSVRANLDLGLRLRGLAAHERRTRIDDAAGLLGIVHLLDRPVFGLSGGEGRRVGLGRALCLKAPLVLLDEPLAGLDPPTYTRLLDDLPRLLAAFSATTVLVTHQREEALRLGQDLVVLIDGRVHASGDKHDVVLNPRDPLAAEILGYVMLEVDGTRVAVRPSSLAIGRGPLEFGMVVEAIFDLVDRREIVGHIGPVRVHVNAPFPSRMPRVGDRIIVHADRARELR